MYEVHILLLVDQVPLVVQLPPHLLDLLQTLLLLLRQLPEAEMYEL